MINHKIDFRSDILPHLIALLTFLVITIGYFNPVFFKNQNIVQYDIQQWQGGAQELIEFREKAGEEGIWTNSMFSGMPGYLINVDWSDDVVESIHRIFTVGLPHPVRMIFAALLSFYIMAISFRVRPYISIIGAIVFGMSSFLIIGLAAGHNARIGAIAYMPLVIAGIHLTLTGKRWLGFGLTSAALALHLRLNHLQITYYLLLIVILYGFIMLISSIRQEKLKEFILNISLLVVAAIIAVASFFGEMWSTYEYSKYSIRGPSELSSGDSESNNDGLDKSYAFQYSNGIFEQLTLFIPNIMGGSSSNYLVSDPESNTYQALQRSGDQATANQLARFTSSYFGKQSVAAPYYAGAVTFLLFLIGILFTERKYNIWLLVVFLAGIVLSWGSNFAAFNYFMFDHFPGYNKFRAVTFTLIISILAVSTLGVLGLNSLLDQGLTRETRKKLFIAFGISGGVCLLIFLFTGMFDLSGSYDSQLPAWFSSALEKDRASIIRSDTIRSFMFILVAFAVIWFTVQKKLNTSLGMGVLILVILIDIWSVDRRYLNSENFRRSPNRAFFAETEADKYIKQDDALSYRVYNLSNPFNDARTSYYHKSIGGYHGAKMRRYQDLYEHVLMPQTQQLIDKLRAGEDDLSDLGAINMLNAKYFYAGNSRNAVFKNDYAYGNAWFVDSVLYVNNPDEEINTLSEVNLKTTAVVDRSKFQVNTPFNQDSLRSIQLLEYAPNKLTYSSKTQSQQLAVFSEIYYPKGWKAFIDNDAADIMRVNYVLRALEIPPGDHFIEFRFEPSTYFIGDKITLAGNLLVLIVLIGSIGFEVRNKFLISEKVNGE